MKDKGLSNPILYMFTVFFRIVIFVINRFV